MNTTIQDTTLNHQNLPAPATMSLAQLTELAPQHSEWLTRVAEGKAPALTDAERLRVVDVALALRDKASRLGITGVDGTGTLTRERHAAHELVNAMAHADQVTAPNPFAGTSFEAMYRTAQRWKGHIVSAQERPTLQQLLNKRAGLIDEVDLRAGNMHEAQVREEDAFAAMVRDGSGRSEDHQKAVDSLRDATDAFQQSLAELRQFRNAPTSDNNLLQVFQDMEALELSVAKIDEGIRTSQGAGIEPDTTDQRDLRHGQIALRAFLQQHDAIMPVHVPSFASPRDGNGPVVKQEQPRMR